MTDLGINSINSIANYNQIMGANLPNSKTNNSIANFEDVLN